jgi:hypothetical protein
MSYPLVGSYVGSVPLTSSVVRVGSHGALLMCGALHTEEFRSWVDRIFIEFNWFQSAFATAVEVARCNHDISSMISLRLTVSEAKHRKSSSNPSLWF